MNTTAENYDSDLDEVAELLGLDDLSNVQDLKHAYDALNNTWVEGISLTEWVRRARQWFTPANAATLAE